MVVVEREGTVIELKRKRERILHGKVDGVVRSPVLNEGKLSDAPDIVAVHFFSEVSLFWPC